MTCLEKLAKANRWRIRTGKMGSDDTAGWNGAFIVPLEGHMWQVLISDGMGFRHLSATNAQKSMLPSWNVMCRLRDYFFADDAWVMQLHPPKDEYINDHPYVLHLWESLNDPIPIPPNFMV